MSNQYSRSMDDLLNLFTDSLNPSEILASKLMAQISSAITSERVRLHMSQEEFADYIDSSQSLVSRWEHGGYNFSLKKVSEIAVKLNLDVNISFSKNDSAALSSPSNNTGAKIIMFKPRQEPEINNTFFKELEEM